MPFQNSTARAFFALLFLTALAFPAAASAGDGFVQFFDDKEFKGSAVTINFGTNVADMKAQATDDGKKGFNDKATSVKYQVPAGWQAVIYEEANFQKRIYILRGSGSMEDLDKADDKCSSFRWEATAKPETAPAAKTTPAASPTTQPAKP